MIFHNRPGTTTPCYGYVNEYGWCVICGRGSTPPIEHLVVMVQRNGEQVQWSLELSPARADELAMDIYSAVREARCDQ